MEQSFQTSFIPKKPIVEDRAARVQSVGFFMVISIFILFAILLASGGLFLYKGSLAKVIADKTNQLILAKNGFEPAKITELQVLDKRLRASSEILSHHIAITPVFEALSTITMKTVRFTEFSYTFGSDSPIASGSENSPQNGRVIIKMSGLAVGYRSVALQSDLFSTKDEGKNFIDPVFSNLTLDDRGNVLFDLEFSVEPSFVDYKQMLARESAL